MSDWVYWGSGKSKTFIDFVENEAENSKAFYKDVMQQDLKSNIQDSEMGSDRTHENSGQVEDSKTSCKLSCNKIQGATFQMR